MAMPSQYARLVFWWQLGVKEWSNVLNFLLTGSFPSNFDIAAARVSLEAIYTPLILPFMGIDAKYLGADIFVNNNGVTSSNTNYASTSGGASSDSCPAEVAAIVRTQSAIGGPSGRGRLFLSGIALETVSAGRIGPASLTTMQTFATSLISSRTVQTMAWHPAIHSKRDDDLKAIVQATAETNVGTQRRRRPRR